MAAGILLLAAAVVLAGSALLACLFLRAVRRRRERTQWDDLVARHQDLDRALENIWQHW